MKFNRASPVSIYSWKPFSGTSLDADLSPGSGFDFQCSSLSNKTYIAHIMYTYTDVSMLQRRLNTFRGLKVLDEATCHREDFNSDVMVLSREK